MAESKHNRGGHTLSAGTSSDVLQQENLVMRRNRKNLATGLLSAALLAMSASVANAGFVLIDDFESYSPNGTAIGSNGWISNNTNFLRISEDPTDASNQVGRAVGGANNRVYNSNGAVEAGNVGTLFFRLYIDPEMTDLNVGIGFTAKEVAEGEGPSPSAAEWGPLMRLTADTLDIHDGPTAGATGYQPVTTPDDVSPPPAGDWHSFWMVADTANGSWALYVQGGDIAEQTRVAHSDGKDVFAFRGDDVEELLNFAIVAFGSHTDGNHPYIDDLYIDVNSGPGGNLANPIPEPGSLAIIGLGSLCFLKRRRHG